MTTTDDPVKFRNRWHGYVNDLELLKQTLHPDDWDELEEAMDTLHDIIDDAADDFEDG